MNKYKMTLPVAPLLIPIIIISALASMILVLPIKLLRIVFGVLIAVSGEILMRLVNRSFGDLAVNYGCWIAGWTRRQWDENA